MRIAVLIPCHNESATVGKVVADFRAALPHADIWVFANASSDDTAQHAAAAGAHVRRVNARGKGHVVRAMFRDVQADAYLMVDGDDTYPAAEAPRLLAPVLAGEADMVVGTRLQTHAAGAFRRFHGFGNRLVCWTLARLFGHQVGDALSGYRAFSRRFVKSMPVLSRGFEIETEMMVFALSGDYTVAERAVAYGARPPGSHSKLRTFSDGARVLRTVAFLYKDLRPLLCFGTIALACVLAGLGCGLFVIHEFQQTGLVLHPSTAVLAVAFILTGLIALATGLVLDTVNRRSEEIQRLLTDQVLAQDPNTDR